MAINKSGNPVSQRDPPIRRIPPHPEGIPLGKGCLSKGILSQRDPFGADWHWKEVPWMFGARQRG